jgi:hypothetical protein
MKKSNAKIYNNIIRKFAINNTILATGLFTLMATISTAQADELIKAEPIKQINLYQEAQDSLALSFSSLTIIQNDDVTSNMMAKQQHSENTNTTITLTKVNLVSE